MNYFDHTTEAHPLKGGGKNQTNPKTKLIVKFQPIPLPNIPLVLSFDGEAGQVRWSSLLLNPNFY